VNNYQIKTDKETASFIGYHPSTIKRCNLLLGLLDDNVDKSKKLPLLKVYREELGEDAIESLFRFCYAPLRKMLNNEMNF